MNENPAPNELSSDSKRSAWIRALYMLLFCIAFNIAELLLMSMALLQLILKLVTGAPNGQLAGFGNALGQYLAQVTRFLTFDSEKMPFPFNDWPTRAPSGGDHISHG